MYLRIDVVPSLAINGIVKGGQRKYNIPQKIHKNFL